MIAGAEKLQLRLVLVTIAVALNAPPCLAQQKASDPNVAAIESVLEKHDNALQQPELTAVLELFAPSPRTVMLGTGPGERFEGKEEIRSAYEHFVKDFDKGSLSHTCCWKSGGLIGDAASLGAMCKMNDSLGESQENTC